MAVQVSCRQLGIQDCSFSASGATPGDVTREVVDHIRAQHGIDMPDARAIMEGDLRADFEQWTPAQR
jgi:predicted small metal-binding protein